MQEHIKYLESCLSPEQQQIQQLQFQLQTLQDQNQEAEITIQQKMMEMNQLNAAIEQKKSQLIQLDDEILFQDFALYRPIYSFANSEQYKNRLAIVRQQQKEMIKNKTAVNFYDGWTVEGSKAKGTKMNNDNIKQILRTFNTECENAIDKVKFNNIESMRARIVKSFESLNSLNATVKISLRSEYLQLKLDELNLVIEYALKKQAEKEEQQQIREDLREQAKIQKELEETRKNI